MNNDRTKVDLDRFLSKHSGFTLVEMVISLVIGGILLSSISVIVSSAYDFYFDSRKKIQLQQDFSLVEQVLSSRIHEAEKGEQKIYTNYSELLSGGSAQTSGSCLRVTFKDESSQLLCQIDNDFYVIDESTGAQTQLIKTIVDTLNFSDQTNYIETVYTLQQGNWVLTDTLCHAFRN